MDCMKAAFDAGINFFDCAEGYAEGKSEIVMGKAIKEFGWKRNDFVISTKINWGGAFGTNPVNNFGLSRKHVIEGTAAALERLGLEYVDLLYAHRPDRETPIEETVRAFNYLINTGKCFYWGTSEWNADEIAEAWAVADRLNMIGPVMEQPQYNLLARNKVEKEFWRLYRDRGLGLTTFSPLKTVSRMLGMSTHKLITKQGILTGRYNDGIPEDSRVAKGDDNFSKGQRSSYGNAAWQKDIEQTRKLKPIADKLGADQGAFALAWVIKNPNVSSAITGASKVEQISKSLKALELLPKLTDEIMKEVDDVLENKPAADPLRFT